MNLVNVPHNALPEVFYVPLPYITYLNYSCPLFDPKIGLRCAVRIEQFRGQKVLAPSKYPWSVPLCILPAKNILSRIFKIRISKKGSSLNNFLNVLRRVWARPITHARGSFVPVKVRECTPIPGCQVGGPRRCSTRWVCKKDFPPFFKNSQFLS